MTVHPLNVTVDPLNMTVCPLNVTVYPLNVTVYPLNVTVHPLNMTVYPLNMTVHPLTLTVYPLNMTVYPLNVTVYPLKLWLCGQAAPPLGRTFARAVPPSPDRRVAAGGATLRLTMHTDRPDMLRCGRDSHGRLSHYVMIFISTC
jgi:hypothetical protein